ncbi:MAG: hypothetical protein JWP01_2014 [Myxococcales bacterium]|nr:hypothetical protein [Myxococcales bacterium]
MRIPVFFLALVLWTASARADGVGVVVTGDATIQPQLAAQIEDWLRQGGHVLVPSPLPSDALNTLIDCLVIEDLACARSIVEKRAKAPMVVFAKFDITDSQSGMRDVTITAYWFETGADASAIRRTCERCTDEVMRTATDELMTSLAGKNRAEVGQVTVRSTPAGATVTIDGKSVGVTPLTTSIAPGAHAVTMTLAGHADATGKVTVTQGSTAELTVELSSSARRSKLPYAVIGGGGALLLVGIVLVATSEEDTGENPTYRDTTALGIGLGVTGLAVAGAGVYLLLRGTPRESGPSVALLPGGAYVGWGRTF